MAYFGSDRKHAEAADKYGVLRMRVNGNNVTNEAHKHLEPLRGSQSLGRKLLIVCEERYESQNSLRIDQSGKTSPCFVSFISTHILRPKSVAMICLHHIRSIVKHKKTSHYTSTLCVKPPHTALSPLTLRRDQCVRPKALFR